MRNIEKWLPFLLLVALVLLSAAAIVTSGTLGLTGYSYVAHTAEGGPGDFGAGRKGMAIDHAN